MFIVGGPGTKLCAHTEKGGHVLRDTTSRGLCVRVRPPHTSERRGGGGGCEQGGWRYRYRTHAGTQGAREQY